MISDNTINVIIIIILIIIMLNSPCIAGKEHFEGVFGDEDLTNDDEDDIGEENFEKEIDF